MAAFDQRDIVRVPFPPRGGHLLWVLMITSAENRPWPGDVPSGDAYGACGLPAPSVVRTAKIAIIEAAKADRIGHLPPDLLAQTQRRIAKTLVP